MTLDRAPAVTWALALSMGAHLVMMVVLPGPAPASPWPARKVEMELYAPVPPRRAEVPRPPSAVKAKVKLKPLAKPAGDAQPPPPAPGAPPTLPPIVGFSRRSTAHGDFAIPEGAPTSGQPGSATPGGDGGDSEPLLLGEVRIPYPDEARRSGVSGSVRLQVTIDAVGRVTAVSVISGPGYGLDEAAREALWKFRFTPATRGGAQVGSTFVYTYTFELD